MIIEIPFPLSALFKLVYLLIDIKKQKALRRLMLNIEINDV